MWVTMPVIFPKDMSAHVLRSTEGDRWGPEGTKVREAAQASFCHPAMAGKVTLSPGLDVHMPWDA